MTTLRILCAALVVVAASVASASAADRAVSIPASTLSSMGLGGVHQMSDNAGTAVRGMGSFALVYGSSIATYKGNAAVNGYTAGAANNHGSSQAVGGSLSYAGNVSSGHYGGINFSVNFAGGGAAAYAK